MATDVLFIHGFLAGSGKGTVELLLENEAKYKGLKFHRVALYPTPEDFTDATITSLVNRISRTITELKLPVDKLIVIGQSLGGILSLEHRARFPEQRTKKQLLLSPVLCVAYNSYFTNRIAEWSSKGVSFFDDVSTFGNLPLKYAFHQSLLETKAEDTEPAEYTEILVGDADPLISTENIEQYKSQFPKVKIHITVTKDDHSLKNSHEEIKKAFQALLA